MEVKYVVQEDRFGCVIACLAMVTGFTYKQVRLALPSFNEKIGVYDDVADAFLAEHGFAVARLFPRVITQKGKPRRCPWPPQPFAPVHMAAVQNKGLTHHMVVVTKEGWVLDPDQQQERGRTRLVDYDKVDWVAGVVKI